LNQWASTQTPPAGWKLDALTAQLPPSLRDIPPLADAGKMEFTAYDGFELQEAVWLRDLSNWARGNALDDRQRVAKLFDWTVRNIELDRGSLERTPQMPWETLLLGRGTAMERAWVFILLARQQGLDAAVLATTIAPEGEKSAAPQNGKKAGTQSAGAAAPVPMADLRPWCAAVLIEGQLYLFDTTLGLPIPAPGGISVDRGGQLDIRPASLAQVAADDSLLRRLDLNPAQPYPVKSADLKRVVLLIEASPQYLARRMKLVESRLAGARKMVLTATPTAQAERLKKAAGPGARAQLWALPFDTLRRRQKLSPEQILRRIAASSQFYALLPIAPLYRARALHLKGQFTDQEGATSFYQLARPSNDDLDQAQRRLAADIVKSWEARVRQLPAEQQAAAAQQARMIAAERSETVRDACALGKQDASFWLGLIAFEQGNYASAIDYFSKRTLAAMPGGPWTHAARYNLARTYEASGRRQEAITEYRADDASPSRYGNLLRARWLAEQK
jgi:tetratricopeptide (TPR) repeat protein